MAIDSILSLLFEISKLFPHHFARHISSLHSLFATASKDPSDSLIFLNTVSIIKEAIEHMEKPDLQLMNSIQDDLQQMLGKGSQSVRVHADMVGTDYVLPIGILFSRC